MSPPQTFWHVANFLFVPWVLGALTAGMAKLVWRRELAGARWGRIALAGAAASTAVALGGLLASGRDGRIETYAAMVVACAAAQAWVAFGSGRR